jgi:hypothetical protein
MTGDQLAGIDARLAGFRRTLDLKRAQLPPSTDPDLWNEEGAQLLALAEKLLAVLRTYQLR